MKKLALLLFSLAITVALPGTSVMAEPEFMRDVNTACGEIAVECSSCHNINDFDEYRDAQGIYESSGACAFCSADAVCSPIRPTRDELLADAQATTNEYFQELFKQFMEHMQTAGGDFVEVFPDCPDIAPIIGSDISRQKGYLARRVTNRTRNARNTPDGWEAKQLEEFEKMAKKGKPRTQFDIIKPDGTVLPTKEFEAYGFVNEEDVEYFRYMRSITMPGPPNEPPFLPCLKCHGTFDQLAPGLVEEGFENKGVLEKEYPYDMALGYKKGDVRGAWTIKIPIVEGEDD
jgi:hypothetical protein